MHLYPLPLSALHPALTDSGVNSQFQNATYSAGSIAVAFADLERPRDFLLVFLSRPALPDFITRLRNHSDPPLTRSATQTACHARAARWVHRVGYKAARASIAKGEESGNRIANISNAEPGWVIV